ncbi:MAG: cadherin-like domain-containing protein [Nitrosarchaeum sp.]
MQKLSGLFLFAILISGAFSSSFAFAQVGSIAENDLYSVDEDSILTIAPVGVLLNDTNIDSDFFAIIQTNVGFGTLTLNLDGSFVYQPNQNFDSVDSFTYFATNGTHNSNNATVTLFVNPINDAPIAQNDTTSTPKDTPVIIQVLNNDTDVDGDSLIINSITQGANGTVTTNSTTIVYTPDLNFTGTDSFTYTVSDGVNVSNSATVTVTVTSVDDEHDDENDDGHDDKVNICHKDKKTISVSENAIPAHLKHGDVLGACDNDNQSSSDKKSIENQLKALKKDNKAKEKEFKEQFKDLKKDKKSKDHNDD